MYTYQATVLRVIDGDTIDIDIDLGFAIRQKMKIRLHGINAPETSTPEGKVAKRWLAEKLPVGTSIVVKTVKDRQEKYGRYLGTVFLNDVNINALLIEERLAIPYLV